MTSNDSKSAPPLRCAAAHLEDPSPCEGSMTAVWIVDRNGDRTAGCIRHGAVALASLDNGRVEPLDRTPDGMAAEVYNRARKMKPFAFGPGATKPAAPVNEHPAAAELRELRHVLRNLGEYGDAVLNDEDRDRQMLAERLRDAVHQLGCQEPGTVELDAQLADEIARTLGPTNAELDAMEEDDSE